MFATFHGQRGLVQQDVEDAINQTYPLAKTMRESITKMREWASARRLLLLKYRECGANQR